MSKVKAEELMKATVIPIGFVAKEIEHRPGAWGSGELFGFHVIATPVITLVNKRIHLSFTTAQLNGAKGIAALNEVVAAAVSKSNASFI